MPRLSRIALGTLCTAFVGVTASDAQVYPGVRFVAQLSGGIGGDPDGRGVAYLWVDQKQNRICATIMVRSIQLPAASSFRVRTWGGPLIFMPGATSSGCMERDEYTAVMIGALLSGRPYPTRISISNAQYAQALTGTPQRG